MDDLKRDNPGVVVPPPLIYLAMLLAGLLLHAAYPIRLLPGLVARIIGWPMIGSGLVLFGSAFRALDRAHTNVEPWKPATTIVSDGPYRYTRNPIYLGFTLVYAGIAVLVNALPPLVLLPVALSIIRRAVIDREERYLEQKFGDEYRRYRARVRRWL